MSTQMTREELQELKTEIGSMHPRLEALVDLSLRTHDAEEAQDLADEERDKLREQLTARSNEIALLSASLRQADERAADLDRLIQREREAREKVEEELSEAKKQITDLGDQLSFADLTASGGFAEAKRGGPQSSDREFIKSYRFNEKAWELVAKGYLPEGVSLGTDAVFTGRDTITVRADESTHPGAVPEAVRRLPERMREAAAEIEKAKPARVTRLAGRAKAARVWAEELDALIASAPPASEPDDHAPGGEENPFRYVVGWSITPEGVIVSAHDGAGNGASVLLQSDTVSKIQHALNNEAPPASEPKTLTSVLDEYARQTRALPFQHEVPERGCCSYNWRMAVIRDLRSMLHAPDPALADQTLGRFGHHADPVIDFCVEVECLESIASDWRLGLRPYGELQPRLERAMEFRVGGDNGAVRAKDRLRSLEQSLAAAPADRPEPDSNLSADINSGSSDSPEPSEALESFTDEFRAQLMEEVRNKTADEALTHVIRTLRRKLPANGELMACEQCVQIVRRAISKPVPADWRTLVIEELCEKLERRGIDTSEWDSEEGPAVAVANGIVKAVGDASQPVPAVPDGWKVRKTGPGEVAVQHPSVGFAIFTDREDDGARINLAYYLASALAGSAPPAVEGWDPIPSYGDHMSLSMWDPEFMSSADGDGYYATATHMSQKHPVHGCDQPGWATHVVWFNK